MLPCGTSDKQGKRRLGSFVEEESFDRSHDIAPGPYD